MGAMASTIEQQGQEMLDNLTSNYSLDRLKEEISSIKPRAFDIWIAPLLLAYVACKTKNDLGLWTRRAVFVTGIYMAYRNWNEYKNALKILEENQ
jgi:hypothetical protein